MQTVRNSGICLSLLIAVIAVTTTAQRSTMAQEVKTGTLPVKIVPAFELLEIKRPIIVTDAGDGTDRVFVASQYGTIYVMPNDQEVEEPDVFIDMEEIVVYNDRMNEEGFLGLAFHPKFKENGEFFVYYTSEAKPHTSVISRFTATDDNTKADVSSEEVLLEIEEPAWNHNGGTLAFGPDGYLYIALGDGGAANDLYKNGQNLSTLHGSILRIDVDSKTDDLAYGIPKDNPFIDKEGARPEIYAYGVRNIWRLSFDRKTGDLWAADVGQDIWEEINIIKKGGNYGWSLREAKHPFGPNGVEARDDLIDPIWEYHHDIGKSITGGFVYRGKNVPELQGMYLFADYVSGKVWALHYDMEAKKVVGHYELETPDQIPVITFGEDQQGEVYFTDPVGRIFTFASE